MTKFSTSEDEILIEEIQKYSAIYDYESENYKNFLIKENAWNKIAFLVKKEVDECKKRWKAIKDKYFKKKKKMKMSTGSSVLDKPSKWHLFRLLTFLDKVKHERNSRNTLEEPPGTDETEEGEYVATDGLGDPDMEEQEEFHSPLAENEQEDQHAIKKKLQDNDSLTSTSRCSTLFPTPKAKKSRKQDTKDTFFSGFEERAQKRLQLLEALQSKKIEETEDDIDLFMKSISLTVKKLPPALISEAKIGILTLVTSLQAKAMSSSPHPTTGERIPAQINAYYQNPYNVTFSGYGKTCSAISLSESTPQTGNRPSSSQSSEYLQGNFINKNTQDSQLSSPISTSSSIQSNRSSYSHILGNLPSNNNILYTSRPHSVSPVSISVQENTRAYNQYPGNQSSAPSKPSNIINHADVSQPASPVPASPSSRTHFSYLSHLYCNL